MRIRNSFKTRLTIALLMGAPSYAFFATIRNFPFDQITTYSYFQYSGLVTVALIVLFEGHQFKSKRLEKNNPWRKNFRKRLIIELAIAVLYPIPVVLTFYSILYILIWNMGFFLPSVVMYCAYVISFSLIFMGFVNANYIISDWRNSIVKSEALEKENIRAKLEALQTQLSPHFLFNNLNIIDALISKDHALAQQYVQRLSKVFRYILDKKNLELIPLREELEFINEFMFLMQTRFNQNVSVEVNLQPETYKKLIPPVSLQLIIENALKHNEISSRNKLNIQIRQTEEGYLTVSNNVKPKKSNTSGTGTGLQNIKERYRYLTNKQVRVNMDNTHYQIEIPLLQVSKSSYL